MDWQGVQELRGQQGCKASWVLGLTGGVGELGLEGVQGVSGCIGADKGCRGQGPAVG